MTAHSSPYPNWLPATRVATMSAAPTPVAATTSPGPMTFHLAGPEASSIPDTVPESAESPGPEPSGP